MWDNTTRCFHWINAVSIVGLVILAFLSRHRLELGMTEPSAALLSAFHAGIGYVLALNLLWRSIWAFRSGCCARWRSLPAAGPRYWNAVRGYMRAVAAGNPEGYAGHNALARSGVAVLLILIFTEAITGLVLAGTELFHPPFGHWVKVWIAAPGVDPETLVPDSRTMYDPVQYASLQAFRAPFALLHELGLYALLAAVVLQVAAVVATGIRSGGFLCILLTGERPAGPGPGEGD